MTFLSRLWPRDEPANVPDLDWATGRQRSAKTALMEGLIGLSNPMLRVCLPGYIASVVNRPEDLDEIADGLRKEADAMRDMGGVS